MSYSPKVDLIKRYAEHAQSVAEREIKSHKKVMSELKECGILRNMVVHAEWETADADGHLNQG